MNENKDTETTEEDERSRGSAVERIVRQASDAGTIEWLVVAERYWYAVMIIAATFWMVQNIIDHNNFGIASWLLFFGYHWKGIIKDDEGYQNVILLRQLRRFEKCDYSAQRYSSADCLVI